MRKEDKIEEIEKYLSELEEITPADFQTYTRDFEAKAACERYFERIIEAVIDLAFLIIKEKKYKIPEEDKEAFEILAKEKEISSEISQKMKEAKGMRNFIAHEYGKIDDKLVYTAITEEIGKDTRQLLKEIRK